MLLFESLHYSILMGLSQYKSHFTQMISEVITGGFPCLIHCVICTHSVHVSTQFVQSPMWHLTAETANVNLSTKFIQNIMWMVELSVFASKAVSTLKYTDRHSSHARLVPVARWRKWSQLVQYPTIGLKKRGPNVVQWAIKIKPLSRWVAVLPRTTIWAVAFH